MNTLSNFNKIGEYLYAKIPWRLQNAINIWLLKRRLLRRFKQKRLPLSVYLETTSACNLNCIMCAAQLPMVKRFKKNGFMDKSLFRRLIDELASKNPLANVRLHKDGEPLLHPEIIDFIDYASSRLQNVTLVTNGTLLNIEMARAILGTQLHNIRFSIDGNSKQTFEKVRKQRKDNAYADSSIAVDYESVLNNIQGFSDLKKALGKDSPKLGVRITNFKSTQQEIDDYTLYWKERVDFVDIAPLLSWSGQIVQGKNNSSYRFPCFFLWDSIVVNWDGTLVPCCIYVDRTGDGKGALANLNTESLEEAFYSPRIQRLRLAHLDNDLDEVAPFCVLCTDWRISFPQKEKLWDERFKVHIRSEISSDLKIKLP